MEERNTLQKEIILRTLCKMREHPTAAMVYEAVHQNHPTISRSTVYRVLAKMAGEGKIRLRQPLRRSDRAPSPRPLPPVRRGGRYPGCGNRPAALYRRLSVGGLQRRLPGPVSCLPDGRII